MYQVMRGSACTLPRPFAPMLSKNQKGLEVSIKSLQATRDGRSSSASRAYSPVGPRTFTGFTLVDPAFLSSERSAQRNVFRPNWSN
jgi:hypothetical protein